MLELRLTGVEVLADLFPSFAAREWRGRAQFDVSVRSCSSDGERSSALLANTFELALGGATFEMRGADLTRGGGSRSRRGFAFA